MSNEARQNGASSVTPILAYQSTDEFGRVMCQYDWPSGLTKREWLAGMALSIGEGVWPGGHLPENASALAKNCVAIADALLEALAEPTSADSQGEM